MNLHDLLEDAVADVEPADRLAELRARTASPARAAARPWWWAAGATVVGTAAAVAVVATLQHTQESAGPAGHGMHHPGFLPSEILPPRVSDPDAEALPPLLPIYYVGEGGLYREFAHVRGNDSLLSAVLQLEQPPADPDYATAWAPGDLLDASVQHGTIEVETADDGPISALAAQQVVYTLQANLGSRVPVRFIHEGEVLLGPVDADPAVLNPVSISDPAEGNEYEGSMTARGRTSVPERHILWTLVDADETVVRDGTAVVSDDAGMRPWEVTVDLAGLEPGTYVFTVTRDDPGFTVTASTDTRTIVVR
ncbi:hypothetical protein ASC77_24195 [Nocardioides sp. Root1257]|uniref:Gmad2 immunoglobulin-like domain-containing protein n=1 Tax=unclassified Nocardioides TaxID=2615069 RepID=UPI0006FB7818|nr:MULTISPECIES: Gmad2 immunoglobulin-like domain-containing protein [unclassified Nocardioides]KQW52488.1 hypothetical protein ASC77_24195 [Nocardioides sp. Root1257]KRC54550.1 hypothetical protein ASE24_23985 [Nocardioides sp. Root224]